jgi:hypothetical protein
MDTDLIDKLLKILAFILVFNFVFWFLSGNDYMGFISMIGSVFVYVSVLFILKIMGKLPPGWLFNR